ncbi:MAG TPA: inositol monophosphatase family protein [Acidimicrobiia bacterium]|nr:inositol monophosphatase family protein [Acidimicrobiia bacterium]
MDDLHLAIDAARAGGEIIRRFFGTPPNPDYKGKFDPVTAVDRASEEAITDLIRTHRPEDEILAEEAGGELTGGRHWIVDPLDGTVNFVHGIPHVSVSIALYDGDRARVGVVYDPMRDEIFSATDGGGTRLNGHHVTVSIESSLERSVIATGFPYNHDEHADELAVVVREVLRRVNGIRRFGSAALDFAWVAAGRYEGYWELGIAPWDGAAGLLLVREAGGTVTDPFGRGSTPFMGLVVASNSVVHDDLRTVIESWMPMRLIDP